MLVPGRRRSACGKCALVGWAANPVAPGALVAPVAKEAQPWQPSVGGHGEEAYTASTVTLLVLRTYVRPSLKAVNSATTGPCLVLTAHDDALSRGNSKVDCQSAGVPIGGHSPIGATARLDQ